MSRLEQFWKYFADYGGYKKILEGLGNTLIIAFVGLIIGIVIGSIIAIVKVAATRNKVAKVFSYIGTGYTAIFRGTPIVVQLLIFHFVIFRGVNIPSPWEATLVFGLNSGAYVAEIMRGGIQSVDVGQLEAGRTLGLSFTASMIKIVIPQAIKNVIPTLGNELIALIKDTSVAGYCATIDLNAAFTAIAGATYDFIVPYIILALVYFVIVLILTGLVKLVERRLRKSEKRH
ncbi:MAG: amino acid ABC transporter permease [Clostridiales bacterium]|nr:amino acid ABC transporter permease [Clostridiales bacterium]